METKASPLILDDFCIVHSNCKQTTNENLKKFREKQAKYPVLADYEIRKIKDKSNFIIGVRIVINPDNLEGYSIDVEGVGYFTINEEMDEEKIANLIHFSALNICIANIRSYIANMTSYFPLGRFNFHAIDMPSLIASKQKEIALVKT